MQQIRLLLVSELWTLLVIHLPISASFPLDLPSSLAWLHASWSALLDSFYFMLPNTGKEYNYVIFLHNTFYLHYISVGQRPSLKDIHDVPLHFCPYALSPLLPYTSATLSLTSALSINYISSPIIMYPFYPLWMERYFYFTLFTPLHLKTYWEIFHVG